MKLKIHKYPHEILRKTCSFVGKDSFGSKELSEKIRQMFEITEQDSGIGLAGPQAGILDHVFVVDLTHDEEGKDFIAFDLNDGGKKVENKKFAAINSVIAWKSKEMSALKEGCLSLPGVSVWVNRPKKIKMRFFDENGLEYFWEMDSLLAKCCQHEFDHLNGRMIIDYKGFIANTKTDQDKIEKSLRMMEKDFL
jgi:peptide deformylase